MWFNKLVRDKIPQIIRQEGKEPIIHIADDEEYTKKLHEKLQEEVQEFLETPTAEELADILEVLRALAERQGISPEQLENIRVKKARQKGSFSQRIVLEEVKG